MEVKQVIVVRKDLNMRKGKLAAQVAHASVKSVMVLMQQSSVYRYNTLEYMEYKLTTFPHTALHEWLNGIFTKVVVGVDSEEELNEIYNKATENGVPVCMIIDNGRTEFHGVPTVTCIAVGPGYADDVDSVTGDLKLL